MDTPLLLNEQNRILSYDLFAYCENDNINYVDISGERRRPGLARRRKNRKSVVILTISQFAAESFFLESVLAFNSMSVKTVRIKEGDSTSLKKAWNKIKNKDIVIINCHGNPTRINGMNSDGVSKLNTLNLKLLILLACNVGHYDKRDSNIGYAFSKIVSGKVVCSDGTVQPKNYLTARYASLNDKYWRNYTSRRSNYGWIIYNVDGSIQLNKFGKSIKIVDVINKLL